MLKLILNTLIMNIIKVIFIFISIILIKIFLKKATIFTNGNMNLVILFYKPDAIQS